MTTPKKWTPVPYLGSPRSFPALRGYQGQPYAHFVWPPDASGHCRALCNDGKRKRHGQGTSVHLTADVLPRVVIRKGTCPNCLKVYDQLKADYELLKPFYEMLKPFYYRIAVLEGDLAKYKAEEDQGEKEATSGGQL